MFIPSTPADPNITPFYPSGPVPPANDLGLMNSETREDYLHRIGHQHRDAATHTSFPSRYASHDSTVPSMLPTLIDRSHIVVGPQRPAHHANAFAMQSTEDLHLAQNGRWPLAARLILLAVPTLALLALWGRPSFERHHRPQVAQNVPDTRAILSGSEQPQTATPADSDPVTPPAEVFPARIEPLVTNPILASGPVTRPEEVRSSLEDSSRAAEPFVVHSEVIPSTEEESPTQTLDNGIASEPAELVPPTRRCWSLPVGLSPARSQMFLARVEALVDPRIPTLEKSRTHFEEALRITDQEARLYVAYGLRLEQLNRAVEAHEQYQQAVDCQQRLASRSVPGHFEPYFVPYRELIRSHLTLANKNPDCLEPAMLAIEDLQRDLNSQLPIDEADPWRQAERRNNVKFLGKALAIMRDLYGAEADRRFDFQERHDRVVAQLAPEEQTLFSVVESQAHARFAEMTSYDDARLSEQQQRQQQRIEEGYYPQTNYHVTEDFRTWHRSQTNWAHWLGGYGWCPYTNYGWYAYPYYWHRWHYSPYSGPAREGSIGRNRARHVHNETQFTRTKVPHLPAYRQAQAVREYLPPNLLTKGRELLDSFPSPWAAGPATGSVALLSQVD